MASPVTYDINFTVTGPVQTGLPVISTAPVGSFIYDQTTQQFSSFVVSWNGTSSDFTFAANQYAPAPSACNSTGGASGAFELMNRNMSGCNNYSWTLTQQSLLGISFFADASNLNGTGFGGAPGTVAVNIGLQTGRGTYSITERSSGGGGGNGGGGGGIGAGVPEPATLGMLALAVGSAATLGRRRLRG